MGTHAVVISGGVGRTVYSDDLVPYVCALDSDIERVTYVEPASDGTWYVDLTKLGGEVVSGFQTRQAALDWEVAWLRDKLPTLSDRRIRSPCRTGTACVATQQSG